jgi:hypothetical protein
MKTKYPKDKKYGRLCSREKQNKDPKYILKELLGT